MIATPTQSWAHQEAAVAFCRALREKGKRGAMFAMAMGCIAGDAVVIVNRAGAARRYTLRDLYRKFHGGSWNPEIPSRTRSLINGELHLNCITDVIHQGIQPVLKISLASGKWIRVTGDHEIATPNEVWCQAASLKPGMEILTNGQPACRLCGNTDQVYLSRSAKYRGLCQKCAYRQKPKRLPPLTLSTENIPICHRCSSAKRVAIGPGARHRGLCMACIYRQRPKRKQTREKIIDKDGYVRLYGRWDHPRHNKAGQVYEHIVVMEEFLGRSITSKEHVHHKDKIRHHNDPTNLEVLPGPGHSWRHGKEGGYLHLNSAPNVCFVPRIDTVINVEADGETDVYDLVMSDPSRNFVANSVIVHNCGKSKAAIDWALELEAPLVLILCPRRVVEVWRTQFLRFAPGIYEFLPLDERLANVREKTRQARELVAWGRERNQRVAIAINWESARVEPFASWALKVAWPLVIADECHKLKEPSGRTARWCARLGLCAHYRLGLSGTPMPHQPIDIWPQFRFLDPSILDPTYGSFRQRHAILGGFHGKEVIGWRDLDGLYEKFRQIAFQVDDSVLDLPPELDETLSTSLAGDGARLYREMSEEMVAFIASEEGQGRPVTAANTLVRLQRLQQITGGTLKDDAGFEHLIDQAKEELLTDFLSDLDPDEPVVVFALFKSDLRAIHRAAAHAGRNSGELSGDTRGARAHDLANWQGGDFPVLAVQIQAGGVGIDLSRARLGVYYSLGFSLADYLQSRARIRRPPQKRPCAFYHLMIRDSIDEYVLAAVEAREDLITSILHQYRNQRRKKACPPPSTI
jgi:hypothetical protein